MDFAAWNKTRDKNVLYMNPLHQFYNIGKGLPVHDIKAYN
jgi:hypothetical protein